MTGRVAVLGGGIGGLTAAHELLLRGFAVEVFNAKTIPGGKSRTIPVPDSGVAGRRDLPGEHGFRFFPSFYEHLPDSMSRIPFGPDGATCADNLIGVQVINVARYDHPGIDLLARMPRSISDLKILFHELFGGVSPLSEGDLTFFAGKLWQVMTSCEERRLAELEQQSWWDFVDAGPRGEAYQKFLAEGLSRSLVAARAQEGSARTVGQIRVRLAEGIIAGTLGTDRVLSRPTSEALLDPWIAEIERLGGVYHRETIVTAITMAQGRVASVTVTAPDGERVIVADQFVSAIPIEQFAPLITPDMLAADPGLQNVIDLAPNVRWMNGIQFFLTEDPELPFGHSLYVDSPWAITSISEAQLWKTMDMSSYGDGKVRGVLSVDISDWDKNGTLIPSPAKDLPLDKIAEEVWYELKRAQNVGGREVLRDDMLHSWFVDTDIELDHADRPHPRVNLEPLFINTPNSWDKRPTAVTAIPNLTLASDYVQTKTDLACMEAANEAARRAVNGILAATGSDAEPCKLWHMGMPKGLAPWRAHDRTRFEQGLPWDGHLLF